MVAADKARVMDAGVDTWSTCWYADYDSAPVKHLRAAGVYARGGSVVLPEPVGNYRVGVSLASNLIWAEGHPAPGRLASGDELPDELRRLELAMSERGVDVGDADFAGVRRLDSTVDLRFDDPLAGIAVMAAVAHLQFPRIKTHVVREVGGPAVETVMLRGFAGKRILGRMYDKGVESRTAPRGAWIRPEDQRRYQKETRRTIEGVTGAFVRERFTERFQPLWQRKGPVKVSGPTVLVGKIAEQLRDGDITPAQARRMAGYIALESWGCDQGPRSTSHRIRRELREAGLYVDASLEEEEPIEVDVSAILERAFDSDSWGAQG